MVELEEKLEDVENLMREKSGLLKNKRQLKEAV